MELSQHTIAKVSGPAWEQLRGPFIQIGRSLLAVSPAADSELFTTYVKFTVNSDTKSPAFAAVWLRCSKRLIVGLAMPADFEAPGLVPPLPGTVYKGLTKYFVVERGGAVPKDFMEWAKLAYSTVASGEAVVTVQSAIHDAAAEARRKAA